MDWNLLIPVLVPLIIAGAKLGLGFLPGWILPILAPILGGALDAGIAWATGHASNPISGAILGSAGVGLRELIDQVKQKATGTPA